jgi:hypothetical protein
MRAGLVSKRSQPVTEGAISRMAVTHFLHAPVLHFQCVVRDYIGAQKKELLGFC